MAELDDPVESLNCTMKKKSAYVRTYTRESTQRRLLLHAACSASVGRTQ